LHQVGKLIHNEEKYHRRPRTCEVSLHAGSLEVKKTGTLLTYYD